MSHTTKKQKEYHYIEKEKKDMQQREYEGEKKGRIALTILVTACVVLTMLLATGIAFLVNGFNTKYRLCISTCGITNASSS